MNHVLWKDESEPMEEIVYKPIGMIHSPFTDVERNADSAYRSYLG